MTTTKIEWTDRVWNPVRGCSKVSSGCENCYAERMAQRFGGPGQPYDGLVLRPGDSHVAGWTGEARFVPDMLDAPLHWRKPCRVFVNSMSDLFHDDVTIDELDAIFGVMWACLYLGNRAIEGHEFQILTKRAPRMAEYLSQDRREQWATYAAHIGGGDDPDTIYDQVRYFNGPHPRIHLGVSVENQQAADERIPLLLQCPAAVRWVSCEPLIGAVRLDRLTDDELGASWDSLRAESRLDWVVCGGESGPNARPMHPDWARSLRDQCREAGVPFWFKQWGEFNELGARVGKSKSGTLLDGKRYEMGPGDKW